MIETVRRRLKIAGIFFGAMALLHLDASARADAAAPDAFAPSGKWRLEGNDGRCVLLRDLVSGSQMLNLSIEIQTLTSWLEVTVRTAPDHAKFSTERSTVGFDDGKPPINVWVTSFDTVDGNSHLDRLNVLMSEFGRALPAHVLILNLKSRSTHLDLPSLDAAMKVLLDCERALTENVGLPPEDVREMARPAVMPIMLTRFTDDYYKAAKNGDPEDLAISRYIIGADGGPTECSLVHRAASDKLNGQACHDWGPLKFKPALNKGGKPVRGLSFERVRWMHE